MINFYYKRLQSLENWGFLSFHYLGVLSLLGVCVFLSASQDHAFRECLLVDPKEYPMVLAEPSSNSHQQRERTTQLMFEKNRALAACITFPPRVQSSNFTLLLPPEVRLEDLESFAIARFRAQFFHLPCNYCVLLLPVLEICSLRRRMLLVLALTQDFDNLFCLLNPAHFQKLHAFFFKN